MNSTALKVLFLATLLTAAAPASAAASNILTKEKKHLECMVSVVRAAPRTSRARYEIKDGIPSVRWRYSESQMVQDMGFVGQKQLDGSWVYSAAMSGIVGLNGKVDTYGAGEIANKWKKKCGVSAMFLFV